jgi:hypothetical protein
MNHKRINLPDGVKKLVARYLMKGTILESDGTPHGMVEVVIKTPKLVLGTFNLRHCKGSKMLSTRNYRNLTKIRKDAVHKERNWSL